MTQIDDVWTAGGALIHVPRTGHLNARFPQRDDIKQWLKDTVRVKSPIKVDQYGRWKLAFGSLDRVVTASMDEFGSIGFVADLPESLTRGCSSACQNSKSPLCNCACKGKNHGGGASWWAYDGFEEMGPRRTFERLLPVHLKVPPVPYDGELKGVKYTPVTLDRKKAGWPIYSRFLCSSCKTVRAEAWDHCHKHMFVRAPLCTLCNTHMWRGHGYDVRKERNADVAYLEYCPNHYERRCSR